MFFFSKTEHNLATILDSLIHQSSSGQFLSVFIIQNLLTSWYCRSLPLCDPFCILPMTNCIHFNPNLMPPNLPQRFRAGEFVCYARHPVKLKALTNYNHHHEPQRDSTCLTLILSVLVEVRHNLSNEFVLCFCRELCLHLLSYGDTRGASLFKTLVTHK